MDTKLYPVTLSILLKPVGTPACKISIANQSRELIVDNDIWITFDLISIGHQSLLIEHYNKKDGDPTTALIIDQIKFNEIISEKVIYQGVYYPRYPQHLIGNSPTLPHQNYLSWNGIWQLDFTLPIYTWLHQVENLGWIYE